MGGGGTAQQAENTQLSIATQNEGLDQQYAQMAQQIIGYGQGLEQPLIQQQTQLASGNPTAVNQAAAPGLTQIANSENSARESIYNNVPAGAGREFALSQLPVQSYGQSANYLNQIVNQAPQELAQLGAGQLQLGTTEQGAAQGSGSLATSAAGGAANEANAGKASTLSFLGSLGGAAASGAGEAIGCWIAEAIYGVDDWRTHLVRAWLNGPFKATWYGSIVMGVYILCGQRVAAIARRSALLRKLLKPVFDMALRRAVSYSDGIAADECRWLNL